MLVYHSGDREWVCEKFTEVSTGTVVIDGRESSRVPKYIPI